MEARRARRHPHPEGRRLKLATAQGDETTPCPDSDARYFGAIRDILESWQRGATPPISVHDCLRAVRLIDQAYALAT